MRGSQRSSSLLNSLLGHSQRQATQYSKGASVHPERTLCHRPENKINREEVHRLAFVALAWSSARIEWHLTWDVLIFDVAWSSQTLIQTVACSGLIRIFEFARISYCSACWEICRSSPLDLHILKISLYVLLL